MNLKAKMIRLYCFRNRKKERNGMCRVNNLASPFHNWSLETCIMPEQSFQTTLSLSRFDRYYNRIQKILNIIGENKNQNTIIGIEHYAFSTTPTPADTMLKELGGCLRMFLCLMKHRIMEIPPTTIKKIFSNAGSSKKDDMYTAFETRHHMPDLFPLLNLTKTKYKHTPHPVEDIVDAFAITLTTLHLFERS